MEGKFQCNFPPKIGTFCIKIIGMFRTFRTIGAIRSITNGHRKFKMAKLDMMTGPNPSPNLDPSLSHFSTTPPSPNCSKKYQFGPNLR